MSDRKSAGGASGGGTSSSEAMLAARCASLTLRIDGAASANDSVSSASIRSSLPIQPGIGYFRSSSFRR
jgi:hypothetical protein